MASSNQSRIDLCAPGLSRLALLLAGVCLSLAIISCTKPTQPVDPGLAADRLGIGIGLGMDVAEAKGAAGSYTGLKVLVLTRDELASKDPNAEMPATGDLVMALYNEYPVDGAGTSAGMLYGRIDELRCFLGSTTDSQVQLLGQPLAGLSPAGIEQIFGHPAELLVGRDGNTHLRYEFAADAAADQETAGMAIRLATSHNPAGNCFAMLLSYVPKL